MRDGTACHNHKIKYLGNITSLRSVKFHQSCSNHPKPRLRFLLRRRYATSIRDPWEALTMKLLLVAAFSAVLVVPSFANATVSSSSSPNLPFPSSLGGKKAVVAYSPNLPFPSSLGGKKAVVAYSPNLPFPSSLGGKKAVVAYSPNLPFPTSLGGKKAVVAYSPNLPFPTSLGGKKAVVAYSPNL